VSTQNAQGVGEFTLLPTTTYLALNKHIKPQNEVIALVGLGGTKGALYEKLIHDFGPGRKSWKQFFPALGCFVFILLIFFFFFFFDRATAARHSCCKFVAALVAVAKVVIYGMRWPKELGAGSWDLGALGQKLDPGLPSEICMPSERSCR